ncbi:unnamed protein product, partial [Mesorhabditis spiculigera]
MSIDDHQRKLSEAVIMAGKVGDLLEHKLSAAKPARKLCFAKLRPFIEDLQLDHAWITQLHHQIESSLCDWTKNIDAAPPETRQKLEHELEEWHASIQPIEAQERIELLCFQIDQTLIPYQTELESYRLDQVSKKTFQKSPERTRRTKAIAAPSVATDINGPDAPKQPMTTNSQTKENHLPSNDQPFPQPSCNQANSSSGMYQAHHQPNASQPPVSNKLRPNSSSGMYQAPPPITHNYTKGQPQASQSPADHTASNRMRPHDPVNHHHIKNTSPTSHSSGPSPSRHFNHQSPVTNDYIYASFTTASEANKLRDRICDARPKGFSSETTPQAEVNAVATRNPDISKPDRGSPNTTTPLESTPIDPVNNKTLSLQKTVDPNINPEPPPSSSLTTAESSKQELSPTSAEEPGSPSSSKQTSQPKRTSKPLSDEPHAEDRTPDENDEAYAEDRTPADEGDDAYDEAFAEARTPDEAISQSLHHHPKTKTTEDATPSPSDPTAADDKTDLDNPITTQLYLDKPSPNNRNSDNSSDGASKRAPTNPLGLGAPSSSHPSQPRPKLLARGGRLCDGTTTITTKPTTATTTTTPRRAGECRHSDLKSQSYSRGPAGAAGPPWEPPLYEDANARHGL